MVRAAATISSTAVFTSAARSRVSPINRADRSIAQGSTIAFTTSTNAATKSAPGSPTWNPTVSTSPASATPWAASSPIERTSERPQTCRTAVRSSSPVVRAISCGYSSDVISAPPQNTR